MKTLPPFFHAMDSLEFAAYRRWFDAWSSRTQMDFSPFGPMHRGASLVKAFTNLNNWLWEQRQ